MRPPDCAPLVAICSARARSTMSRKSSSSVCLGAETPSMEIPSSHAGVVKELKVGMGDKINIGDLVLVLESASAPAAVGVAISSCREMWELSLSPPSTTFGARRARERGRPVRARCSDPGSEGR